MYPLANLTVEMGGQITKYEDTDDKDNRAHEIIEDVDGLVNIVKTAGYALPLPAKFTDRHDHFIEADVTVAISVEHAEAFFGLSLLVWTENLHNVLLV